MVPVTPPEIVLKTGPPLKPTVNQGIALENLSHSQNELMCASIMDDFLNNVVGCDEAGSQGPKLRLTTCVSATCSLSCLDPPVDLSMAISSMVSKNARYIRKAKYNCKGCARILKNTSYCVCGLQQEFPASLFKRTLKKSLSFFQKLGNMSHNKNDTSPPTMVSLHVWARIILSHHGVVFAGILSNTTGLSHKTACNCFTSVTTVSPTHEYEDKDQIVLDTSGNLFDEHEVLTNSYSIY